jgi:hypothetical protein
MERTNIITDLNDLTSVRDLFKAYKFEKGEGQGIFHEYKFGGDNESIAPNLFNQVLGLLKLPKLKLQEEKELKNKNFTLRCEYNKEAVLMINKVDKYMIDLFILE